MGIHRETVGAEFVAGGKTGQWADLSSLAVVETHRKVLGKPVDGPGDGTTVERRYYISRLAGCDGVAAGESPAVAA